MGRSLQRVKSVVFWTQGIPRNESETPGMEENTARMDSSTHFRKLSNHAYADELVEGAGRYLPGAPNHLSGHDFMWSVKGRKVSGASMALVAGSQPESNREYWCAWSFLKKSISEVFVHGDDDYWGPFTLEKGRLDMMELELTQIEILNKLNMNAVAIKVVEEIPSSKGVQIEHYM